MRTSVVCPVGDMSLPETGTASQIGNLDLAPGAWPRAKAIGGSLAIVVPFILFFCHIAIRSFGTARHPVLRRCRRWSKGQAVASLTTTPATCEHVSRHLDLIILGPG